MTRLWQNLGWPAFLTVCLASPHLRAEPPDPAPPAGATAQRQPSSDDPKSDIKTLLKVIDGLKTAVTEFHTEFNAKHTQLTAGQADLENKLQSLRAEIEGLTKRLGVVEKRADAADARAQKPAEEPKIDAKKLADELSAINKTIADLKADLNTRSDAYTATQLLLRKDTTAAAKEMDELKQQLAQLRRELESMRTAAAAQAALGNSRVSNALPPPPPAAPAGPPGSTGTPARVRLINSFVDPVAVIVNQNSYRLEPGETRVIEGVRPGTFTYQVLGVQQEARTLALAAGETMTINVYPIR